LLLFSSCLFTTQSFNRGKLLKPGSSSFAFGYGQSPSVKEYYLYDSRTGTDYQILKNEGMSSYGIHYRLGVLDKLPFGQGMEIGWIAQGPIALYKGVAASLELSSRLGIPPLVTNNGVLYHNVSLGWNIGQWIDNTWFTEYAAGFEFEHLTPYIGIRAMIASTDLMGQDKDPVTYEDDEFGLGKFRKSDRSFKMRLNAGIALHMGDIPLFPEFIIPEASFIFPEYDALTSFGTTFSVGLQWEFK